MGVRPLRLRAVLAAGLLGAVLLVFGVAFFQAQRADYGFDPGITAPAFPSDGPQVLFDEGHHNASTAGFSGRYWPFARLLRADGYAFERIEEAFTRMRLERARVLVIANASGAPKPQIFGLNIPVPTNSKRSDPAFTDTEIAVVRAWVEQGGALLLIADHAPFGEAVAALAEAFGVTMRKGFVEVPNEPSDPLLFSRQNGRLGDHPILAGNGPRARVDSVMTYTGQSLDGPAGSAVLLRLPETARESVPQAEGFADRAAGRAQALALEFGRGRVVVLGEGAMATAQVYRRVAYGMNVPDNDNRQFVLNVLYWLSRRL